ncbi:MULTISPECIES: Gmad2 immunoglobulin-like domain-containing protein [unclassified Bacillus (in: firmicutes)]|uniref:Gmad2 immunoglobulin-like domain-containing protein n=1 Tax=unclassified Bacillus (in: firmicutes) TaxID=185979 RepID=UPI0008E4A780|nr:MULTISPECIES: Gmad2 immunoglobulin-like domain-containing protein [unclassified Bacillus (in: firmicutes)]SFA89403.1 Immunoglobulin-like domain of spore germination [Bacillus sp. UNCCL13]SFQ84897.1 Immunoglobulin-like domain of spore germination [Bacillus sp. cl95]
MKKLISISLMIILSILYFRACNHGNENQEDVKNNPTIIDKDAEKEKSDIPPKLYENDAFKEVTIVENNENLVIKGKARVFEGVFHYAVVVGKEILKEEYYQTDGAPAWGEFSITISKELVVNEGTKLELFTYSAKDGSETDVLEIPLKSE